MISRGRCRDVGDRVATFAYINCTRQCNNGDRCFVDRANGPQSGGCVVAALGDRASGEGNARWQLIDQ